MSTPLPPLSPPAPAQPGQPYIVSFVFTDYSGGTTVDPLSLTLDLTYGEAVGEVPDVAGPFTYNGVTAAMPGCPVSASTSADSKALMPSGPPKSPAIPPPAKLRGLRNDGTTPP